MKSKIYTAVHYSKPVTLEHKKRIESKGGKVTIRKLYDESLGKHYYELTYKF